MIILYPGYSFETLTTDCSPEDAGQLLAHWSAAFHPALLEKYNELPRWESASTPPYTAPNKPVCVPPCSEANMQEEWFQRQEQEGGLIVRKLTDRNAVTQKLLQLAGIDDSENNKNGGFDDEYTADCRSLATAYFLTDLLVRQLHYMSMMDDSQCSTNVFDSLKAYRSGNRDSAYSYLRQAFEAVCQSKEYFYPIHSYFIDLTLVTPESVANSLPLLLRSKTNTTFNLFLSNAVLKDLPEDFLKDCPENNAVQNNTVQVVADYDGKLPLQLLPLLVAADSIVSGKNAYRDMLNVSPAVFGMLTAGLTTFLPQILKLAGYKGAVLFAPIDGWRLNEKAQSKILWQGSDGTKIDALVRYPLNASADADFFTLAEKLGETINNDTVPTAVFARFPSQYSLGLERSGSFWVDDLQRMSSFTDNMGEFVSIEKYFDETKNSGAAKRFGIDTFQSKVPFDILSESVQQKIVNPISRWNEVWKNSALKNIRSAFTTVLTLLGKETNSGNIAALTKTFAETLTG
ncbi:MAG: hypothetical protein FWE67_13500, partial [Planctomycetaceae bacterium]|nr:hypothetical protein [Planctomycetaceae bacterium]